jgi:hypothetical protein
MVNRGNEFVFIGREESRRFYSRKPMKNVSFIVYLVVDSSVLIHTDLQQIEKKSDGTFDMKVSK